MGFMDKIKGKLSSSSSSGSGENKRASFVGSSPQAAAAAPSSTQTPSAANPATSATAAAPAATTTTTAAAATAPATTAPATATTTTPATAASNPATTAENDTSYQPEPATEANKSTAATPTTSSTNMTSYTGTCHCKHHEWTVELTPDQSKHILWYVPSLFYKQSQSLFFCLFLFFLPQLSSAQLTSPSHCDTCKILGGGAYTLNQIIPKSALKITKGGEPGKYTYYGDSGKVPPPPHQSPPYIPPPPPSFSNTFYIGSQLLLLPQMYLSHLPSSRSHGPRNHYCSNGTFARGARDIWGWGGNLWEGEDELGTEDCGDF